MIDDRGLVIPPQTFDNAMASLKSERQFGAAATLEIIAKERDSVLEERDRLARENARLAVELEATIERASQVAFEYLRALNYSVMAFNVRAVIRSRVATKVAATP